MTKADDQGTSYAAWMPSHDPCIGDLVNGGLLTCLPETSLREAATKMRAAQVSCILVCQDDRVVGIWTEGDARRLDFSDQSLGDMPVKEWMSHPVVSALTSTPLNEASLMMRQRYLRRLLILDEKSSPVGMITQSDIVRHQGVEHYLMLRDVGSSLTSPPLVLDHRLPLNDAVKQLRQNGVEAAIVQQGDDHFGIITERDLIRLLADDVHVVSLGEVAHGPLITVTRHSSMLKAVETLREHGFRHLGVKDDESGELCGLLSLTDILSSIEYEYVQRLRDALADRDKALRASAEHLKLAHKVIDTSLDGIIITNSHGVIELVNPSFTTLTGYSADEAVGQTPALLSSGRHPPEFYAQMWETLKEQGFWQGEIWNKRKNGEIYPEWLTITAIHDEAGNACQYAAIFSDITDRKLKEERIHTLAYFDELTGLANRRLLMDRMRQALANAHRHRHQMAVLFLDLDLFKRINDTLGHHAGDAVLREVAYRLESQVGESGSVARLGGDEFSILLPEIRDTRSIETLCLQLIERFQRPIEVMGQQLVISTSVGISLYPQDGDDAAKLLKHADTAMYRAKELGRNHYSFFNADMSAHNQQELIMEHALRRALDHGGLSVHYQPKVDVARQQMIGLEALARWHDPELGPISPVVFIPLAEKLGLIDALGQAVLDQVCQDLQRWSQHGDVVPIAVNVSARQMADRDFLSRLQQTIKLYQVNPGWIELELTESCLVPTKAERTLTLLQCLRDSGFRLSIDDFGTGYSSLAYLRRLPLDTLKIDAGFVRELPDNQDDVQIVTAVIGLAHGLGLSVVAEGVETLAQSQLLSRLGCSVCQGFWLARPAPASQVVQWLAQGIGPGSWTLPSH